MVLGEDQQAEQAGPGRYRRTILVESGPGAGLAVMSEKAGQAMG